MNDEATNLPVSSGTKLWILYLALFSVFVTWACFGVILYPLEDTKRGTFGDMFGAVNALFSGLAFAALIYTVFMQREELALQRQDLKETREELKRSASAQEASEAALRAQAEAAIQSANLAAINNLLPYYRKESERLAQNQLHHSPPFKTRFDFFKGREKVLTEILDSIYQKITEEHASKQQQTQRTPVEQQGTDHGFSEAIEKL